MNQDGATADNIGGLQGSQDSVAQQPATQPLTLIILVDREPPQNDYGDRTGRAARLRRPGAVSLDTEPAARL